MQTGHVDILDGEQGHGDGGRQELPHRRARHEVAGTEQVGREHRAVPHVVGNVPGRDFSD